jgi:flap endonuclease-1
MGVRMLNRYLREYSNDAMKQISISELSGKKLAIDISIFMYQYKGNNSLLENMTKMIMLFRDYHVVPIFVFDGTPPDEKMEVLNERDATKKEAKQECRHLEDQLRQNDLDTSEREKIENLLSLEQKKCLRITNANIRDVKNLINLLGVSYLEADGEADDLCVYLVRKRKVWACMTEDMDMFVYGCQRVLRNFNLEKGTMTLYSMMDILKNLKMTQNEFRDICLLSGTDYNRTKYTIYTGMSMFYKYMKKRRSNLSFYDWLVFTKNLSLDERHTLVEMRKMFLKDIYNLNEQFTNKRILKDEIVDYMEKHNINYLNNV